SLAKIESGVKFADIAWWSKFNDPQFNSLIESALANNSNIQMAIGNITKAQGYLQQIEMQWIPTVGAQASYSSSQLIGANTASPNATSGGSVAAASSNSYATGLVPTYTLNIFQQMRTQDASKAALMNAIYTKDGVRLTILSQVVGGYLTLLGQTNELKAQNQLVADLAKQLELSGDQYRLGYISLLNLQTYEQQYYMAKAQVPIIENNIVQSQNALRVLTNQNLGYIKRTDNFMQIKTNGIIPVGLPSDVLKNRPDIMQAEENLKQYNANIGVATSNFFPSISLTSPIGSSTSALSSLFSVGTDFWQNQIQIAMPILNLSLYGQIKSAKGQYYNAYYSYINAVRVAFQQVDNGLSAHQKLTDSYNYSQVGYQSTQLGYDIGNQRYQQGADSYSTMLNSKITMDKATLTVLTAKLQQLTSIVNLYQYLAGGYNVKNVSKPKEFGDSHDA
ncbi:MAG: efflux transporter outer membrane subunit, partial [Burkholderiales bacterium]|nr:efflux transporter outer membrane subunit [Burkholderiales bacterium]